MYIYIYIYNHCRYLALYYSRCNTQHECTEEILYKFITSILKALLCIALFASLPIGGAEFVSSSLLMSSSSSGKSSSRS